ncbi:hypothetical protein ACJX0J_013784, partial [Zea mays]
MQDLENRATKQNLFQHPLTQSHVEADWVDLSLNEVPLFGRKYTHVLWEDNFPNTFLRFGILWQLTLSFGGQFLRQTYCCCGLEQELDITKAFDSVSWPFLIELWMFLSNVYPI